MMIKNFLITFLIFGFFFHWTKGLNVTADADIDDDDEIDELNFEEFKKSIRRYRRLIPYMSYYVANNYVNQNGQFVESSGQRQPQRQRAESVRKPIRTNTKDYQAKFIPSVQYDPKEIGGDNNYFMPVRYNTKINYDEINYQEYNKRRPYMEITTPSTVTETRYYKERPRVPYNPVSLGQSSQLKQTRRPDSYLFDYVRPKPTPVNSEYYPVDYEPIRYIKVEPSYQPALAPAPSVPVHHQQHHHQHQQQQPSSRVPLKVPANRPNYISRNSGELNEENLIKSLQLTNQLPEMLNRDNIDSSIKTLVEILTLLHGAKRQHNIGDNSLSVQNIPVAGLGTGPGPSPGTVPVSLPVPGVSGQIYEEYKQQKHQNSRPKVVTEMRYQATSPAPIPIPNPITAESLRFTAAGAATASTVSGIKPSALYGRNNVKPQPSEYSDYNSGETQLRNQNFVEYYTPLIQDIDEKGNRGYLPNKFNPKHKESAYEIAEEIDEVGQEINTPLMNSYLDGIVVTDSKNSGTKGKPGVDYPTYTDIPVTSFSCKDQRYKGFFGDPATRCQVWHYCDLNGGKSSFLCPNGTIFSQIALTCDWWFNVKCESTTQLYVLNERLYKFILPIMPKFPEDFSGPEVDRYLELKFKEMEAKLKAKKLKKAMEKKGKDKPQAQDPESEPRSGSEPEPELEQI
ncbi:uncharacterized protein LOC103570792 [Microplitis demolitor]|uniref:uncharacterized protein LOC103570792 n=1 Tax=Microplitis demolitor TaxID=69319 RepID=UPI0004CD4621|nr:uncharacterized protein LOC103570792 [Microplitis demolitor]